MAPFNVRSSLTYSTTTDSATTTMDPYFAYPAYTVDCSGVAISSNNHQWVNSKDVITKWIKNHVKEDNKIPDAYIPVEIIFNGPATIVFWADDTKTVVKRSKKDKDNKYNAFCAALAKKVYGTNSHIARIVKKGVEHK